MTEQMQEHVERAKALQAELDAQGYGAAPAAAEVTVVVSTPTIYVVLRGVEDVGYPQGMAARTSLEAAQSVVEAEAASQQQTLNPWRQRGSGTWLTRVQDSSLYYEILAMRVLP